MKLNLSKSQYVRGLKCAKSIWFYKNRKDIERTIGEKSQQIMAGGQEVGEAAQRLYPEGILIKEDYTQIDKAIQSTQEAVKNGATVLFEATASSKDGNYARIDIFKKVPKTNEWDMIEVKCSTEVADYYLDDISFQRHVFEEAGYRIRKSILLHINNNYLREGELDLKQLFTTVDLTVEAENKKSEVIKNVKVINDLLSGREPRTKIGKHCEKDYECDYVHYCWKDVPEYSVLNIGRFSQKWDFYDKGIVKVEDLPSYDVLNPKQIIEVESYINNKPHIEKDNVREFLNQLEYPLYYLDYETVQYVIPPYNKTHAYQQIPFQFSLHIQKEKGGELKHIEFLHEENSDPRLPFIKKLIESCGKSGSVIVYNAVFERSIVNNKLIEQFSEYEAEINSINERMVDLLKPFSDRVVYHPKMHGSASIKKVLPAFVPELSYQDLEIQEGGTASRKYLETISSNMPQEDKNVVFKNLKRYCGLDTMAMVKLLEVLYKSIQK